MLLIFVPIAWIAVMTVIAAMCCMAARGDRVQVSGLELGERELSARPAGPGYAVSRQPTETPRPASPLSHTLAA